LTSLENEAKLRDPRFSIVHADSPSSSNLPHSAHVIQSADNRRMQSLPLDQIPHRIVAGNRQPVILPVKRIDKAEEDLGPEAGWFELIDIVPVDFHGKVPSYGSAKIRSIHFLQKYNPE
jgi:hypothetical protein